MAEEKKISVAEVRKTISTSLAAAFGFVIALLWNTVVTSGLKAAGVDVSGAGAITLTGWASYLVLAIVLTVVMILFIIVIGRWGTKGEKKEAA